MVKALIDRLAAHGVGILFGYGFGVVMVALPAGVVERGADIGLAGHAVGAVGAALVVAATEVVSWRRARGLR